MCVCARVCVCLCKCVCVCLCCVVRRKNVLILHTSSREIKSRADEHTNTHGHEIVRLVLVSQTSKFTRSYNPTFFLEDVCECREAETHTTQQQNHDHASVLC